MKRLFILAALLSAAALVSCQSIVEQDAPTAGDEIKFSASVGNYRTKVADDAFEEGDAVALTALSPINVNGVKLTWTNGSFLPEQPVYWGRKQTEETLFAAVYPYNSGIDAQQGGLFTTGGDQSDIESYKAADLLIATTSGAPGKTVNLPFKHVLSRVDIRLRSELPVDGIIVDDVLCDAYIYPLRGSAFTTDESRTSVYIPYEIGNGGYSLIVPPQTSSPKIVIYSEDKEIVFAAPQPITLESGKIMRASVTISADAEVTFTSEIIPWEEGESFEIHNGEGAGNEEQTFYLYEVVTGAEILMEKQPDSNIYKARVTKSDDYDCVYLIVVDNESDKVYGSKFEDSSSLEQWIETDGDLDRYIKVYPEYGTGTFDVLFNAATKMVYVTEFEPLGIGEYWDNVFNRDFNIPAEPLNVEIGAIIDGTGIYQIKDPYLNTYFENHLYVTDGSSIVINAENPDQVYMENCFTGLITENYWMSVCSHVSVVGWEDAPDSNYGVLSNGEILFPTSSLLYWNGGWFRGNRTGPVAVVLPGYSRHSFLYSTLDFWGYESYSGADGEVALRVRTVLLYDNLLLRAKVFEGSHPTEDEVEQALEDAQAGTNGFREYDFTYGNYTDIFFHDLATGNYWVMLYTEAADDTFWFRYFNVKYLIPGEEPPAAEFSLSDPVPSEIAPDSEAKLIVTGEVNYVTAVAIPVREAEQMSDSEIWDFVKAHWTINPGEAAFMEGYTITVGGMKADTEYRIYVMGHNSFDGYGLEYVTYRTGSSEWTSLGYGLYYDSFVPAAWGLEGYEETYVAKVEILVNDDNPSRFRVMYPYRQLWADASDELMGLKGLDPSDYIEFYTVTEGGVEYVFFQDYCTGMRNDNYDSWQSDTDWTIIYHNYIYGVESPSTEEYAQHNIKLAEGVYQIAPMATMFGTNSYFNRVTSDNIVFIVLPGYEDNVVIPSGAPRREKRVPQTFSQTSAVSID